MTPDEIKHLPALNDDEMRKQQLERFSNGIGEMGDFFRDIKKQTKINMWVSIGFTAFLLFLFVGGAYVSVTQGGGIGNLFGVDEISRRFNCTSDLSDDVVKYYDDAVDFVELYNGSCTIFRVNGE